MSNRNNSEIILFASIPKPNDLCYFRAEIQAEKYTTDHHKQIMKCRLLISSSEEIMASPFFGTLENLHVITSRNFHNEGKLKELLSLNNLQGTELELSNEVYESCLRYTMLVRLSPSWNYVEPYLVQGKDFLTNASIMNAVKVQIIINGDNAHVVIWPRRVKLPPFLLRDYAKLKKNLSKDQDDYKYDFTTDDEKIFALPRMTQCRIETISRKVPPACDNNTYADFKRFWKNKYGYCLPESDEDIFYVTVRFGANLRELVYPNLCVRQNNLILLPPVNCESILGAFSCDLSKKLSNICTTSTMGYAVSKLNSSTEIFMYPNWSPNKQIKTSQDNSAIWNFEKSEENERNINKADDSKLSNSSPTPVIRGLHFTDVIKRTAKHLNTFKMKESNNNKPLKTLNLNRVIKSATTQTLTEEESMKTPTIKDCTETTNTEILVRTSDNRTLGVHSSEASTEPNSGVTHFQNTPKLTINHQISLIPTNSDSLPLGIYTPGLPVRPVDFVAAVTINENQGGVKRLGESIFLKPMVAKKPRSRPLVQEDIDVEDYAKRGLLTQANVATLLHFLRKNSVPCKVKDKKSELISKILTFLNLTIENPPLAN